MRHLRAKEIEKYKQRALSSDSEERAENKKKKMIEKLNDMQRMRENHAMRKKKTLREHIFPAQAKLEKERMGDDFSEEWEVRHIEYTFESIK